MKFPSGNRRRHIRFSVSLVVPWIKLMIGLGWGHLMTLSRQKLINSFSRQFKVKNRWPRRPIMMSEYVPSDPRASPSSIRLLLVTTVTSPNQPSVVLPTTGWTFCHSTDHTKCCSFSCPLPTPGSARLKEHISAKRDRTFIHKEIYKPVMIECWQKVIVP